MDVTFECDKAPCPWRYSQSVIEDGRLTVLASGEVELEEPDTRLITDASATCLLCRRVVPIE